jgi:GT2 family glycosyltransferase
VISVIVTTRNNETDLALALSALVPAATEGLVREVIVVDRGSADGTAIVADAAGCDFIPAGNAAGEARRQAAERAKSDWLLFLSPRAMVDSGWQGEALAFMDAAINSGAARRRAATLRFGRMEPGMRARREEFMATARTRLFAAPREEQGLLVSKALYRSIGGHRDLAAFAELDLARRIGRRRLWLLRARALVRHGSDDEASLARSIRNGLCFVLLLLRLPPRLIDRLAA